MDIEEHLFRHEAARLTAILTRLFGINNLALVEDVVQDAFCRALETWKFHGVPKNPSAWLMTTAKHRALDVLRREGTAAKFAPQLALFLESEWTRVSVVNEVFAVGIADVQLQMMFSCIHPDWPEETQLILVLNLLCGFSSSEVAAAFLKKTDAIVKKIHRAKRQVAATKHLFQLTKRADIEARLPSVLGALYLLFNEGYHSASTSVVVRTELCEEALRLISLLLDDPRTNAPATYALAALFYFLLARLPSRIGLGGHLIGLAEQDRLKWDSEHIAQGRWHLERAAEGNRLSVYHIEAAIAEQHADATSLAATDWASIISLYDTLLKIRPSPVVALNRAIAIAQHDGPQRGLKEISQIADLTRLSRYAFYFVAIGEFHSKLGHHAEARAAFTTALKWVRNPAEKQFITNRLRK